jgi:hypothetical protein
MVKEVTLNGDRFHLLFSIGKDNWTTVLLQNVDSEPILLGCKPLMQIVSTLLDFLVMRRNYEYTSTYHDTPCHAVVVLLEPHAILFVHSRNDLHRFFAVERFGSQIAEFVIDEPQAAIWENALRQWLQLLREEELSFLSVSREQP